ncbi:MAG: DUF4154 domain-containing protein [Verrucomicrobia bacterium]|nr:MAG: DUF4154 domain-containing protein [Verrucomicrobiota bacterium]
MSPKILPWVAWVACLVHSGRSLATPPGEYETKAGHLLNFVEFVEWPAGAFPDAKSPIVVGVMGKDPFGAELDKLQDKVINGRRLQIKRFKGALEFRGEETPGRRRDDLAVKQGKKLAELKSCHILFISSSERNYLPLILKPLKSASVLTVGETELFLHEGGIINFLDGTNRLQLEISLDAAERARLKISSKLLSLAKVIKTERSDGQK